MKIPPRTELTAISTDYPSRADEIKNHFENNVDGISYLGEPPFAYTFSIEETKIIVKISNPRGVLISFWVPEVGHVFSAEKFLSLNCVPEKAKKIIAYNLDIFTKTEPSLGWNISESVGIEIVNTRGLTKLNVKKD